MIYVPSANSAAYPVTAASNDLIATPAMISNSNVPKRIMQIITDIICVALVFVGFIIVLTVMSPRIRYYTCDQSDVSYPYIPDTITFYAVGLFCTLPPLLIFVLIELGNARLYPFQNKMGVSTRGWLKQFGINLFHVLSVFALGISITLLATELGKRWIGRLRPYFMSVCKPSVNAISCTTSALTGTIFNSISTGGSFCTGDSSTVSEARLSMPSGHSSYSFYCMVFLALYLQYRLFLLRFRYVKVFVQTAALLAAFITTISRISDYHHRGSDVVAGMVLGTVVALIMIYFVGNVLFEYNAPVQYSDFDLKPWQSSMMPMNSLLGGSTNPIFGTTITGNSFPPYPFV